MAERCNNLSATFFSETLSGAGKDAATMYPNAIIVEYSIDHRDQEVKLNNRIELTFDLKGRLIETEIGRIRMV